MPIQKSATTAVSLGLILALVATTALPAIAGYKPRPRRPPKQGIGQLGTRDGCDGKRLTITPLAPTTYIAEFGTSSPKPPPLTLGWAIAPPKAAIALNVAIYRYGKTQALVTSIPVTQRANGNWTATLNSSLSPGRYGWQLRNQCGQSVKPMTGIEEFDVSVMPLALQSAINQAKTPTQRSQIYAEAGFWYNALHEALLSPQPQVLSDLVADLNNRGQGAVKP